MSVHYLRAKHPELVRELVALAKGRTPECGQFKATWLITDEQGETWALKRAASVRELRKWKAPTGGSVEHAFRRKEDDVLCEIMAQELGAVDERAIQPYVAWAVVGKHMYGVQFGMEMLNEGDHIDGAAADAINEWNSYQKPGDCALEWAEEWGPVPDGDYDKTGAIYLSDVHNVGRDPRTGKMKCYDWGFRTTRMSRKKHGCFIKAETTHHSAYR